MSTSDRIQALRKRHHLTQQQLADRLHVSRATVANWETGRVIPGVATIRELSRVFETPVAYLVESRPAPEHIEWTVPDEALRFLSIERTDTITFRSFSYPREGALMLFERPAGGPRVAGRVESYAECFYLRLTRDQAVLLDDDWTPLGYALCLTRRFTD